MPREALASEQVSRHQCPINKPRINEVICRWNVCQGDHRNFSPIQFFRRQLWTENAEVMDVCPAKAMPRFCDGI